MEAYHRELLRFYADDAHNRKYHGVGHILDLLQLLHTNKLEGLEPLPTAQIRSRRKKTMIGAGLLPLFSDPVYVEAAIYGHDMIYDSNRKDNEEQSATLTSSILQRHGWRYEEADRVAQYILATKPPHNVPELMPEDWKEDVALLLSMDLAVGLALEGPKMHAATDAIRFEYRQYDDEQWTAGRKHFFESMLEKTIIFPHDLCEATWGPIARKNMEAGLKLLGA